MIRKYADDVLILAGCVCLVYGIWQFSPAAAWIVGGLALVAFGAIYGKVKADAH